MAKRLHDGLLHLPGPELERWDHHATDPTTQAGAWELTNRKVALAKRNRIVLAKAWLRNMAHQIVLREDDNMWRSNVYPSPDDLNAASTIYLLRLQQGRPPLFFCPANSPRMGVGLELLTLRPPPPQGSVCRPLVAAAAPGPRPAGRTHRLDSMSGSPPDPHTRPSHPPRLVSVLTLPDWCPFSPSPSGV